MNGTFFFEFLEQNIKHFQFCKIAVGARARHILPSTSSPMTSSTPVTSHVLDSRTTSMTSSTHGMSSTPVASHVLDPRTTLVAWFFGKDGTSSLNFQEFSDFLSGKYF